MASSSFHTLHVRAEQAERTLAAILRESLKHQSWSQVKKLVRQRRIQIKGNVCLDEERRLQCGDVIRIGEQAFAAPVTLANVGLVHVDAQVIVVEKPSGITTLRHAEEKSWSARRKNFQPTPEELVAQKLNESLKSTRVAKSGKLNLPQVHAVHRLDRDTSGLMVFARTPEAETHLIRQFKKHSVQRAYLAIAVGTVPAQTISNFLVRDRGDGLRGGTTDGSLPAAERAVTHVKPLEDLSGFTVLECQLETGRTHQIRIHLSELGHPLCGEKTYVRGFRNVYPADTSGASRQMLHAAVLGFEHPTTNQMLQFVSPLPTDMHWVLEQLRKL